MRLSPGATGMSLCLTALIGLAPAIRAQEKLAPKEIEFFESKIRPVLVESCYTCHSADAEKNKKLRGGLLLDSAAGLRKGGDSGPTVVPGKPKEGTLLQALRSAGDLKMPPSGKLSETAIADFEKWIAMGAPDPRASAAAAGKGIDLEAGRKFWAFQPPKASDPPLVKDAAWNGLTIDRFVKAKLDEKGLKPAERVEPRVLLRRLSFDLIGLPPTFEEVEAFAKDSAANPNAALEKAVDRLLASKRFGERWGRHWLDVARYADSNGNSDNYLYPHAWRYRNWVFDAFNADQPIDRFIVEQLAGDLLPADTDEKSIRQTLATGFLAIGSKNTMLGGEEYLLEVIADQIDAVGRGFLGLSVACARCHDHKLDPIPTADYYALAGIFRNTSNRGGYPENGSPNIRLRAESLVPLGLDGKAKAAELLKDRAFHQYLNARDGMAHGEMRLKSLPANAKENDRKNLESLIVSAQASMEKHLAEVRKKFPDRPIPEVPELAMGVAEDPKAGDIALRVRGEANIKGAIVPRGFLRVLSQPQPAIAKTESGRLQLANWIASRDNPLTARVFVNRVWYHLFARGLVATPDDFGSMGRRPSHPELLDHLAISFVDDGWSAKKLIRRIVLSRAYRLGSGHDAANVTADPDNEWLWRHGRRFLDVEAFRDSILTASGRLDPAPKTTNITPDMLQDNQSKYRESIAAKEHEAGFRTVYLTVFRDALPDALALFDFGDPTFVNGTRSTTTVSTQALYLMNSPFVIRESRTMAKRLLTEADTDSARLGLAYKIAYLRLPTAEEERRAAGFLSKVELPLKAKRTGEEQRIAVWGAFCQVLLASAEFRIVE